MKVEFNQTSLNVSVSLGISAHTAESRATQDEIIDRADQAMYIAKTTGKNKVHSTSQDGASQ